MAESLEALEDKITCSICFEFFREPVTLLCKHSYCRECLQAFADAKDKNSTSQESDTFIQCPQCRDVTHLGQEGVSGLSTDLELVRCISKMQPTQTCSPTPIAGYMPNKRGGDLPKSQSVDSTPLCIDHQQPYIQFCATCDKVICLKCLNEHDDHRMKAIDVVVKNLKVPMEKKTKECEELQSQVEKSLSSLNKVEKDLKRHEDLQRAETRKAYDRAMAALNRWKDNSFKEIEGTHRPWYNQCRAAIKNLVIKQEELERSKRLSLEVLSGTQVDFLKDVKELDISIDNQLSKIKSSIKAHDDIGKKLRSTLKLHPVVQREVSVLETQVTPVPAPTKQVTPVPVPTTQVRPVPVPTTQATPVLVPTTQVKRTQPVLKFTKTDQLDLHISDSGSTVVCNKMRECTGYTAWTDGRITSGQITWGVEVTFFPSSPNPDLYCMLGITQGRCTLRSNPGHTSWYVVMGYRDNQVRCDGGDNCRVDVTPGYDTPYPHTGPHRLGVCLNCDNKTLTLTDCDQTQVMATVRGINMSQTVIPAVGFAYSGMFDSGSMTARLFPWNGSPLP